MSVECTATTLTLHELQQTLSHDHYANHPDMTIGQCAEGCLATEGCTGFEVMTTFSLHVEGSSSVNYSPYCALWYSYACTGADSPGWTSGCGASLSSGTHPRLTWRVSRGVIWLRPPPGGPHAAKKLVFCTRLKKSFLRS